FTDVYPVPGSMGRLNAHEHIQWECSLTPDEAARFIAALRAEFEKQAQDTGAWICDRGERLDDGRLEGFYFTFEAGNAQGGFKVNLELNDDDRKQFPYKLHLSLGEDV